MGEDPVGSMLPENNWAITYGLQSEKFKPRFLANISLKVHNFGAETGIGSNFVKSLLDKLAYEF